ncbi:prepilin-type N-terminal cleavage/methylation domain-containing protein [Patescibacteria group bacterium]
MNIFKEKKKGFTLIELLIVIAIIAAIITISVSSYGIVRRKVKLDIAANTIESMIVEARDKTRSGYYETNGDIAEAISLCFGFRATQDEFIERLKAPYDRLRLKDDKCNKLKAETIGQPKEEDNIVIKRINLYGDADEDEIDIYFAPPRADVELNRKSIQQGNTVLTIVIGYKNSDEKGDKRVVVLNMLTGNTFTDKYNEKYE